MERKDLEHVILKTIIFLMLGVLIVMHFDLAIQGLLLLLKFMSPLLLGFAIAFVINVILVRLEQIYFPNTKNRALIKSRRPVCITLSLLIIVLAIAFLIVMVIPELVDAVTLITKEISESYESILNQIGTIVHRFPPVEQWLYANLDIDLMNPAEINWESFIGKVMDMLLGSDDSGILGNFMDSTVNIASSIGSGIVTFFIALVFGVYALASKERLGKQIKQLVYAYIRPKKADKIYHVCHVANETFSSFIVGQCTEAVILGVLCIIGMSIFRFPCAVMVGTLVGATALIPILGAYIGAGVGAIMVLTQSGPWQMLFFVLFIIVLQQLEGNLIYPKVVGSSVGLPGIWVLAAVTIGGSINGIFGMLIGVPLAATIYRLLKENSQKRLLIKVEQNQKIPTDLLKAMTPALENTTSESTSNPGSASNQDSSDEPDVIDEIVSALNTTTDSKH